MDFLITSRFVLVETILLCLLTAGVIGTYLHDIYIAIASTLGYLNPRKIMQQKKQKELESEGAERQKESQESLLIEQKEEYLSLDQDAISPPHLGESEISEQDHIPPILQETQSLPNHRIEKKISKETRELPQNIESPHSESGEGRHRLIELIALIQTRIARGEYGEAKSLIIEGLSIDRSHRELQLLLADLYERDGDWRKAEIIYRDLDEHHPMNEEIMTRLARVLVSRTSYAEAYEYEKKILSIRSTEPHLFLITNLAWQLRDITPAYEYATQYIRQHPRSIDILWIRSQAAIELGHRREAIDDLIRLKHLSPYDTEIGDLIQKLVTEEEMAKNFGG